MVKSPNLRKRFVIRDTRPNRSQRLQAMSLSMIRVELVIHDLDQSFRSAKIFVRSSNLTGPNFPGVQFARETENWAAKNEGPNFPGLRQGAKFAGDQFA